MPIFFSLHLERFGVSHSVLAPVEISAFLNYNGTAAGCKVYSLSLTVLPSCEYFHVGTIFFLDHSTEATMDLCMDEFCTTQSMSVLITFTSKSLY